MFKIKEKNQEIKAIQHSMANIVLGDLNLVLSRSRATLKAFSRSLVKPLYEVRAACNALEGCLCRLRIKRHRNTMSGKLEPERILKILKGFRPSAMIHRAHSLRLHYTSGIEFMAEECGAWNLIMAIKPIFEMLASSKYPVAIKLQGNRGNRTKVTYYDGEPGKSIPGDEYIEIAFPLEELTLFYAGGVLMLANEYHPIS